ncbi:MAG TPA: hypothetical protein DCR97_08185 [Deltaproteobacteria bacterium]|nr:hypothetical protein [Deltaproteobacteria bacterium]
MKKLFVLFIAIAFISGVALVGCGPKTEEPPVAKEEATPAPTPPAAPEAGAPAPEKAPEPAPAPAPAPEKK